MGNRGILALTLDMNYLPVHDILHALYSLELYTNKAVVK